jgi:NAD(P)-dependent dehydrogenase (short-subunit alcohol dehydrogenase family)
LAPRWSCCCHPIVAPDVKISRTRQINSLSLSIYINREMERQLLPAIPLGRLGTPEDIADVVVLLASEGTRWMTGQVIQVAGGHAL